MRRWRKLLIPGAAVLLAAVLNTCLFVNAYVPTGSMEPGIPAGSMVLGSRAAYFQGGPQTGDVVLFHHPEAGERLWLIKRIIAVPGQTFTMQEGRVYIDGQLLEEPYVEAFSGGSCPETVVPEGCYIVLGDNRKASNDSRFWEEPFVRREEILAKGLFVYFPEFCKL